MAQGNTEGDLILKIGANTKNAKTAIADLSRAVKGIFDAFKGKNVSSPKLDTLKAQAEQSVRKIEELKQQIESMRNVKTETKEFQKLSTDLDIAKKKLQELLGTKYKGLDFSNITDAKNLPKDLYEAAEAVNKLQIKLKQLKAEGKDTSTEAQRQPEAFKRANEQLRQEQLNLERIKAKILEIENQSSTTTNRVGKSFNKMGNSISRIFDKIKNRSKSTTKTAESGFTNLNKVFQKGFKTLLKYGLGMRSFFFLFRRLRSAVFDAYKELASFSDEVNESISGAKSALTKLKNSVAAAIQPIVQVLAPIVTQLADNLAETVNKVAQFFAALTGQSYVYQAVDVQEKYADSLDDTADSATKAKKALESYLSPLDDINRFTAENNEEAEGTPTAAKFTKTGISNNFKDLALTVKDYFKDIFKPIKDAWNRYGVGVTLEWYRLLSNIKGVIRDIAIAFRNVWTNGSGEKFVGNILQLWKSVLGIINAIIGTFRTAWNKDALGESVIQSFIDRFNNLLTFIRTVADTFKEVWEAGVGERIWSNILTIVRNINDIIGGFWHKLTDAWKANENGKKLWETILGIVEDITRWFKELSEITLDWIEDLDFSPLLESINLLLDAFKKLLNVLGDKFKDIYKQILLPLAKWTIEKAVPAIVEWLANALDTLSYFINAIPIELLKNLAITIGILFAAFKTLKIISSVIKWFEGLGEAFWRLEGVLAAHPYAAILIGVATAITAVVTAIQVANRQEWNRSKLKKAVDDINEYSDSMNEAADNMKRTIEEVNKQHIEVQADVSQVMDLKSRLQKIISDGLISSDELPEYRTIMDLLKAVDGFDEAWANLDLEEVNGQIVIHTNIDEANRQLDEFFEKWSQTQYKTIIGSSITDLYKAISTNRMDVKKAQKNVSTLAAELENTIRQSGQGLEILQISGLDAWVSAYEKGAIRFGVLDQTSKNIAEAYVNAKNSLSDYNEVLEQTEEAYNGAWHAGEYLNGNTQDYIGILYQVESGLKSEGQVMQELEGTGITTFGQLKTLAEIQRDIEIGNNEAVSRSNDKKADNAKSAATGTAVKVQGEANKTAVESEKAATRQKNAWVQSFNDIEKSASEYWGRMQSMFGDESRNSLVTTLASKVLGQMRNKLQGIQDFEIFGLRPFANLTIPGLAKGAVLPAGKPFLAMLGDQSNGKNLEAPESLIRQIVREETANNNSSNNTYTVPVQVGRDTLFTLVLEEAKLKRNQTGYNPLLLYT